MSDMKEKYLEWLLNGQKGARPGGPESRLGVPVGEAYNPEAGLPVPSGPRALEPLGPRSLLPPAAGAAAEAASAPWLAMLPATAAALYSEDLNTGEQDMIDKLMGTDLEKKQNIFDRVSDAYARNSSKVADSDAPKVVPAKKQAPTPKKMEQAAPTTPQVKNIEDLRMLKRLSERAQLQSEMGIPGQQTPEDRLQERTKMRKSLK